MTGSNLLCWNHLVGGRLTARINEQLDFSVFLIRVHRFGDGVGARRPVRWRAGYGCSRAGLWRQYSVPPGIAEVANVLVTEKVDEARHG